MDFCSRIKYLLDKKGVTPYVVAAKTGVSQATLSRILNNTTARPSMRSVELLAKYFDVSAEWLLTGNGEMQVAPVVKSDAREKAVEEFVYVPMVPIRAKAGYLIGFGDKEYIETLPTVPVITDRAFHGKYRCFEVEGDSMDDGTRDALCDRDVVMAREVKKELWQYKLHIHDWEFVIVHKEGILIKRIVEHDVEDGVIVCHSLNPLFGPDFTLSLADVYELYNVIKIVDRSARR